MVIDKVENIGLYLGLGERIAKALEYIKETDFSKLDLGRYEIEGDAVFALVQSYDTKDEKDCKLESHTKYIDVQFIVSGVEQMGLATLTNQQATEVKPEKDVMFYKNESMLHTFNAGMFGIFYPNDLHKPCISLGEPLKVKKVVVKVMG